MIVDGYVRVSQVAGRGGERFISPVVQREQIEAWAKLHRATVGEVFEELDESGSRSDRPLLLRALERVEAGESHGVVVAKLDRFGRSLVDSLAAIERIQAAGGTFASVQDGLDLSTDTGRLVLRIMLSMAEWELDRIRTVWSVARATAIRRGVHIGAVPPFGYHRGADGRLVVDPATAPHVREVFRMRTERATVAEIRNYLESNRVLTNFGNPGWCASTIIRLIGNRAYLGEVHSGKYVRAAAHEPLVDAAMWQQAQRPLAISPPPTAVFPLLTGLVRCAGCRRLMSTNRVRELNGRRFRSYTCSRHSATGQCPAPTGVSASLVEPYVEAVFWQETKRKFTRQDMRSEIAALELRLADAEAALARYRDNDRIARTIGEDRFDEGLARRAKRLEVELLHLAAAKDRLRRQRQRDPEQLAKRWPTMSVADRRAAIAEVIECVFVTKGTRRIDERTFVCLAGEGPIDLPGAHINGPTINQFKPSEATGRSPVFLRRHCRPWPVARLHRELRQFVAGRPMWPSFEEFQEASRIELYEQVKLDGGPDKWSTLLGVPYRTRRPLLEGWDPDRVRAELATMLEDCDRWPDWNEFVHAGRYELRVAVDQHGRADYWAKEFGLPPPRRQSASRRAWTDQRIERELREFVAGRDVWPTGAEFEAAGRRRLWDAAQHWRGHDYWARKFGLPRKRRVIGRVTRWAPATVPIRRAADREARDHMPSSAR